MRFLFFIFLQSSTQDDLNVLWNYSWVFKHRNVGNFCSRWLEWKTADRNFMAAKHSGSGWHEKGMTNWIWQFEKQIRTNGTESYHNLARGLTYTNPNDLSIMEHQMPLTKTHKQYFESINWVELLFAKNMDMYKRR